MKEVLFAIIVAIVVLDAVVMVVFGIVTLKNRGEWGW